MAMVTELEPVGNLWMPGAYVLEEVTDGSRWSDGSPGVPQTMRRRKVAVIGAGISGLATAKYLLDEGLDPVLFEQTAQSGGLWGEVGEASLLYPSLRTNTSKYTGYCYNI